MWLKVSLESCGNFPRARTSGFSRVKPHGKPRQSSPDALSSAAARRRLADAPAPATAGRLAGLRKRPRKASRPRRPSAPPSPPPSLYLLNRVRSSSRSPSQATHICYPPRIRPGGCKAAQVTDFRVDARMARSARDELRGRFRRPANRPRWPRQASGTHGNPSGCGRHTPRAALPWRSQ